MTDHQHRAYIINHRAEVEAENERIDAMERNWKPAMLLFILIAVYVIGSYA
ncbi:MAG: hypothetical protein PHP57_13875 [Sideroxydans sp.]|nr:hypothetical protein [Sideroxydans sp.]